MISIVAQLQYDCVVVLDRVFTGSSLTFFGEDGNGQFGRSTFPVTAKVKTFNVEVESFSDDYSRVEAYLYIFLDGYSAALQGHAITDENLRINLNMLLAANDVDPSALTWGPLDLQGEDRIVMKLDVQKVLEW